MIDRTLCADCGQPIDPFGGWQEYQGKAYHDVGTCPRPDVRPLHELAGELADLVISSLRDHGYDAPLERHLFERSDADKLAEAIEVWADLYRQRR